MSNRKKRNFKIFSNSGLGNGDAGPQPVVGGFFRLSLVGGLRYALSWPEFHRPF
jgi:hypothetical protein